MNKKGFAISIVLYAIVFLLVNIFYLMLGILKTRYSVSRSLRNDIMEQLNSDDNINDRNH